MDDQVVETLRRFAENRDLWSAKQQPRGPDPLVLTPESGWSPANIEFGLIVAACDYLRVASCNERMICLVVISDWLCESDVLTERRMGKRRAYHFKTRSRLSRDARPNCASDAKGHCRRERS